MAKKKYGWMLFFFCLLLGMLGGCQPQEKKGIPEEEGGFTLYYLNAEENGLEKVRKELDLPADSYQAIGIVLQELAKEDAAEEGEGYHTALNKQIMVQSWEVAEDGNVNVDFAPGYNQMDTGREILVRAAVVKTLVQIEQVDTVTFTVNQEPLTNEVGDLIGVMRDTTFVMDKDKKEVYNYTRDVDLYYANQAGDGLVKKKVTLEAVDNEPMERVVLEALKSCNDGELKSPLPPDVEIRRVSVIRNICYVDLSQEIEKSVNGVTEEVKIYAMVNSLTTLGHISQVQFTIEGELCAKLNSVSNFDFPMSFEYRLTEENEQE